jgi:hypothetical protein
MSNVTRSLREGKWQTAVGLLCSPGHSLPSSVRDAFRQAFDIAAVLTNDTDLVEPMRMSRAS